MPRKVDPDRVAWFAPETLNQAELAAKLAQTNDPDEALEILNSRPAEGEYREHLGDEIVDGPQGTTAIGPKFGDLVVWVDEAPDDEQDGSGHFERYTGDPADYEPRRAA